MKRKLLIGIGIGLALLIGFYLWYDATYSMSKVESYEIGTAQREQKVLIATQGSEYKNNLVRELTNFLDSSEVYVKIIDVSLLESVKVDKWSAILVVHTWEKWSPEENAEKFLKAHYQPEKVFVVTTSGGGDEKIAGVDAITGASLLSEIPNHIEQLKRKLSIALQLKEITY